MKNTVNVKGLKGSVIMKLHINDINGDIQKKKRTEREEKKKVNMLFMGQKKK